MMAACCKRGRWPGWTLALCLLACLPARAQERRPASDATRPAPRKEAAWIKLHHSFIERARKGDVDVLFLGDSITYGWSGRGKEVWRERFEPLKAANFGISGDRTQHVLWRITAGKELQGIHPKVVVLMIGTNNMGGAGPNREGMVKDGNSAEAIADGIAAVVRALREQRPETKILLLGIFPRGEKPETPIRAKIKDVNQRLARLDDSQHVRYLDIGRKFVDASGNLHAEIMPDYLHLTRKGYEIWADAIQPALEELLKKS